MWLPLRAGPLRPWLQAGYREPFGDLRETGAQARFPPGSLVRGEQAEIRAEYTGGAHAALGVDLALEAFGRELAVAPYVGGERAGYEARLQLETLGSLLGLTPEIEARRDLTVDGVLAGVEARTPLLEADSLRIELLLGAEHLEPVDGEETLAIATLATATLEVEDVWRGRAGLLVSF